MASGPFLNSNLPRRWSLFRLQQTRILWNGHYKYDYMTDEMSVLGEGMIDWVASDWSLGLYDKYGVSE